MNDHDELCQYKDQWNAGLSVGDVSGDCPGCSFVAKVRADERERERGRRIDRYDTTTIQEILSDEREDLRAKVDALVEYVCPEWEVDEGDDLGRHLRKDQVLALFDGEQR